MIKTQPTRRGCSERALTGPAQVSADRAELWPTRPPEEMRGLSERLLNRDGVRPDLVGASRGDEPEGQGKEEATS